MYKVNWLAIIVADIVFFLFGGLWYSLLFKNQWIIAAGKTPGEAMAGGAVWYPYAVAFIAGFFIAYGIARMLSWRENVNAGRGAFIGFSMGLLIFGAATWMDYAFGGIGMALGWINIGYVAIGMALQGALIGAWKPKPA